MANMQRDSEITNRGDLITPTMEVSGGSIPDGYKVTRCNTDHIACMLWNPIGVWEPTSNQVLRLASPKCGVEVIKSNGIKMRFNFMKNDYRYSVDKWLVFIHQNEVEVRDK